MYIIVATPGRIIDLIEKGIANVSKCHMLVLDEVSWMLGRGDSWSKQGFIQGGSGGTLGLLAINYMYDVIIALTATIGI